MSTKQADGEIRLSTGIQPVVPSIQPYPHIYKSLDSSRWSVCVTLWENPSNVTVADVWNIARNYYKSDFVQIIFNLDIFLKLPTNIKCIIPV